tara:strand:- start:1646 stop:2656 length:1011 start_codon:yes stop_codon:yes gene_type:complete
VRKLKILAIKFKYLGDVAVCIPALRSLHKHYPNAEIHFLVASDAAPIVEHIPWVDRIWPFPRKRGKLLLGQSIPMLAALRRERFDFSVDFVGNDRGAILSYIIGAEERLGPIVTRGFLGRTHLYTRTRVEPPVHLHESIRNADLLTAIGIPLPEDLRPELYSDPSLKPYAENLLPEGSILCHLSTSMPKKEWPLERWADLYRIDETLARRLVFITGPSKRERERLTELKARIPGIQTVEDIPDLAHLLAIIDRASALICGDTAPAHLAAGLSTPYVAIFGPSTVSQWDPRGHGKLLIAEDCACWGHPRSCLRARHCLADISAHSVYSALHSLSVLS